MWEVTKENYKGFLKAGEPVPQFLIPTTAF